MIRMACTNVNVSNWAKCLATFISSHHFDVKAKETILRRFSNSRVGTSNVAVV